MTNSMFIDEVAALRRIVFGAVEAWNIAHPHPLQSHREHASVNVAHVYGDATGMPTYTVTIVCAVAGSAQLTFHGHDVRGTIEQACLTVARRIERELNRREDKAREDEFDHKYGVAV